MGGRVERAADRLVALGLLDLEPRLYLLEAADYQCRVLRMIAAQKGCEDPGEPPAPPSDQWMLDAASMEPAIPLVRAESVTIEGEGDEEESGDFDEAMLEAGIRPLTMEIAM